MYFSDGEKEYRITFSHVRCQDHIEESGKVTRKRRNVITTCRLMLQENKTDTGHGISGISECGLKDNFNKEKGRKKALSDALRDFPRDARSDAWGAYFARNIPSVHDQIIQTLQDIYEATGDGKTKEALDKLIKDKEEEKVHTNSPA